MASFVPRSAVELISRTAVTGRRIGLGVVRQVTYHPQAIERLDASGAVLWPANHEEAEPPRWRLDMVRLTSRSPVDDRGAPCVCASQRPRRLVRQGS